ncbi:hypothetical protein ACHAW5_001846 [Stephanodiscus triporus]|uniref:Uncharacterized protein n=1 Tax=Stephanodiscus triporus TaxID=2934178 RepID=A0ABD3MQ65_9STRA
MCQSVSVPTTEKRHETSRLSRVWRMMHARRRSSFRAGTAVSLSSFATSLLVVAFACVASLRFSSWLPFVMPLGVASASSRTYVPAWYVYDVDNTRFDNTAWTYGTDYALTMIMLCISASCMTSGDDRSSLKLRIYSSALLACYGASTLAGGYAHQHYSGVDALNTVAFRSCWTATVGNVAFASAFMGLIGREVQVAFGVPGTMPLGPWWFWPVYGAYMAVACGLGYMSYKRPACDIFIAGITQFPTTAYCILALGLRKWPSSSSESSSSCGGDPASPIDLVRLPYRMMYYIGFVGNSPLLPMYPLLVQYSGMSLGAINALLHAWLMTMWGMQGISLIHLIKAIGSYESKVSKKC